jgi:peptidoglycan/xylan/chitin deacetylase (PgdA/CDA1 family)
VGSGRSEKISARIPSTAKTWGKSALGSLSSPIAKAAWRRSLTVVCYHRVVEQVERGLFPEVVSASPGGFEQHLDMMSEDHTVVTLDDVVAWLGGGAPLPPRALLVTFDDGYRDNYDQAFPILRKRGLPATFFIATGHMDTGDLLWWDLVTVLISDATSTAADLPLLGPVALSGAEQRASVAVRWVTAAKVLPNVARLEALDSLAQSVSVTPRARPSVAMTWDQARKMADAGMTFGGHTRSHPVLSRMSPDDARRDIAEGLDRIREELGRAVIGFAYPNGARADFDGSHKQALADLGVAIAFSLVSGPALLSEITTDPYEVRRIYVGQGDDPERLRLKLLGWSRVSEMAPRMRGADGGQENV